MEIEGNEVRVRARAGWMVASVALSVATAVATPATNVWTTADALNLSLTEFACRMYQSVASEQTNAFFSPMSIAFALSTTYAGSAGNTEFQIARALSTDLGQAEYHEAFRQLRQRANESMRKSQIMLSVAKILYAHRTMNLSDSFLETIDKVYGYEIRRADFEGAGDSLSREVNAWVRDRTQGRIRSIVDPHSFGPESRLLILNAIYFKALWQNQFLKDQTREEDFHLDLNHRHPVPMMRQRGDFRVAATTDAWLLEMPYRDKTVSMLVILPRAVDGLREVERTLSAERLSEWTKGLRFHEGKVRVFFPRFRIEHDIDLRDHMVRLGVTDAFDPRADLSGMTDEPGVFVNQLIHKAGVIVNEEGTEAWAVTGEFISMGGTPPPPDIVFRADRPFMFMIRVIPTGEILFMGRVGNPRTGSGE